MKYLLLLAFAKRVSATHTTLCGQAITHYTI